MRHGRFSLSQGDTGTQHLQRQLDEIDAQSPNPPFADADNRFLVSTLPVEPAITVAIGIGVIARASGPGCVAALGPMPGRVNVPKAIQRVVSAHWMQEILCMKVANGLGGPEPPGEVLEAVIKGNIARTDAEQLREWYLEAHTFLRSRQERSAALDSEYWRPVQNLCEGRFEKLYGVPPATWRLHDPKWGRGKQTSALRRDKENDVYEGGFHHPNDPVWSPEAWTADRQAWPPPVLTGAHLSTPGADGRPTQAYVLASRPVVLDRALRKMREDDTSIRVDRLHGSLGYPLKTDLLHHGTPARVLVRVQFGRQVPAKPGVAALGPAIWQTYTFGITDQFLDKKSHPGLKWKLEIQNYGTGERGTQAAMNAIAAVFRESDIHPATGMVLQKQRNEPRAWGCTVDDLPRRLGEARVELGLEELWRASGPTGPAGVAAAGPPPSHRADADEIEIARVHSLLSAAKEIMVEREEPATSIMGEAFEGVVAALAVEESEPFTDQWLEAVRNECTEALGKAPEDRGN